MQSDAYMDELEKWTKDNPPLEKGQLVNVYDRYPDPKIHYGIGRVLQVTWDSSYGEHLADIEMIVERKVKPLLLYAKQCRRVEAVDRRKVLKVVR